MRTSKNLKMMSTDLKKIQKSAQERVQKEIQSIIQLIDLPDFDVSEFFQTVMKSGHHQEVLKGIPSQKLIDFFSRNFSTYIQTQDELAQLKLPVLDEIPKAKTFYFEDKSQAKKEDNPDEASAIEIVDSFSTAVLQKNNEEILRILGIIKEMKNHSRYQKYFDNFNVSKLYRQSYETFIETFDDAEFLLSIGEVAIALKKFLKQKLSNFIAKIRTDVNVDSTTRGIKKIMNKVFTFIQETLREVKEKYASDKFVNPLEADTIIPKFLSELSKEFYQVVEPCVYEKQELLEVLEALEVILESSAQLESKGVNLSRQLRSLIALDLPSHMNKIVEVVIEAFEDILKDENKLYQFKYFDGMSSLGSQLDLLHEIRVGEYGKKCCSQKGILLINAFAIILEPLCDQKWEFLLENVLEQLMDKVKAAITNSKWHHWDYYQLFYFFDKMKSGKVKHKKLYQGQQPPAALVDKFSTLKKLSYDCWQIYQTKITTQFWLKILSKIPDLLWEIRPYITTKSSSSMKPTVFSIDLIFSMDDFLKQITFRLQKQQYFHLVSRFFEYVMFVLEYVLYRAYHHKGTNEKVFTLYKKSERTLKKAKLFAIQELQSMKQNKKLCKIEDFTKIGVENLALDLYFFTEAMKMFTEYEKFNCDAEVEKISQIQAKQHKSEPAKVDKSKFSAGLEKFMKILKQEPDKIKSYLISKRKQSSKSGKQG